MGKSLETGQLAGYITVDTSANEINIGAGVTIDAGTGSVTAARLITSDLVAAVDNLVIQNTTLDKIRNKSVSEVITSNTFSPGTGFITLDYGNNSNVGIVTNATSDITLNVTSIPTSSDFDNTSISFSVICVNAGVARSCTTVYFNGTLMPVKWYGGDFNKALSGAVTDTTGYDIYNFVGINTVGSASTVTNYDVLGVVNGNFF